MKRIAISIALAMAAWWVCPSASFVDVTPALAAQPDDAHARYERGVELFKEGDYRAALIEFKRAHELEPNYRVLYNIGQVYYQLHDYANALETLEQYLAEGKGRIGAKRRKSVEVDIAKLRPRVAQLEVVVNVPDAEILVDDVAVGRSPMNAVIAVSAGRRKVTVSQPGREPVSKFVDVAGRETATVTFQLGDAPLPPKPKPEPDDEPDDVTEPGESSYLWIGWVVTGTLAVGAVITGSLALSSSSSLEDTRAQRTNRQDLDDMSSQTVGLAVATDVLVASAAVAGTVTLIFTLLDDDEDVADADEQPEQASVQWTLGPTGVGLHGRF